MGMFHTYSGDRNVMLLQVMEPLLQTIANNFVSERSSGEAMAVG